MLQNAGKTVSILNYGVPGQTIDAMQSDAVTQIDPNHTNYDILVGLELVNQWGNLAETKETIYGKYKQYFLDRKAAGFAYAFACTPHDQGYYARTNWTGDSAYFISNMVSEFPALGIGVIDCGSDSKLSNWADTTYFSADKIHLNNAGQAVQAQYVYDALMTCGLASAMGFAWTATNGWSYDLQETPTLVPPAWTNVAPFTNMTGLGAMAITNALGTNKTTFYRLNAVATD